MAERILVSSRGCLDVQKVECQRRSSQDVEPYDEQVSLLLAFGNDSVCRYRRSKEQTPFGRRTSTYLIYECYTTARSHRHPRIQPVAPTNTWDHTHHHESFTPCDGHPKSVFRSAAKAPHLLHLFSNWRTIVDTKGDDPCAESVLGMEICLRFLGLLSSLKPLFLKTGNFMEGVSAGVFGLSVLHSV